MSSVGDYKEELRKELEKQPESEHTEDPSWNLLLVEAELIKAISKMRVEIDGGDKSHQRVLGILKLSKEVIKQLETRDKKQAKEIRQLKTTMADLVKQIKARGF